MSRKRLLSFRQSIIRSGKSFRLFSSSNEEIKNTTKKVNKTFSDYVSDAFAKLDSNKAKWTSTDFLTTNLNGLQYITESLVKINDHILKKFTSDDFLIGLTVLAHHNSLNRQRNSYTTADQTKQQVDVPKLRRYLRFCNAAYAKDKESFLVESQASKFAEIVIWHKGDSNGPQLFVVVNHDEKEIIVVIRGSATVEDFIIDISLDPVAFQHGYGHTGMVHSALWFEKKLRQELADISKLYPNFSVIFTGHSLGAGIAALLSVSLKPSFKTLRCYCFATPACLSLELAKNCNSFVTTIICGDDVVPRIHEHSLNYLYDEVSKFDWKESLKAIASTEWRQQQELLGANYDLHISKIKKEYGDIFLKAKEGVSQTILGINENMVKFPVIPKLQKNFEFDVETFRETGYATIAKARIPTQVAQIKNLIKQKLKVEFEVESESKPSTIKHDEPVDSKDRVSNHMETFSRINTPMSLYTPGNILLMYKLNHVEETNEDNLDNAFFVDVLQEDLSEIVISDDMVQDHLCSTYDEVMQIIQNTS